MIEVRLPREGSTTMAAGVVLEWLVEEGDAVVEGQVLVEIETDKVSFEVAAPGAGTVRQRCADVGDEVEVGAILIRIGDPSEPLPDDGQLSGSADDASGVGGSAAMVSPRSGADSDPVDSGPSPLRASPAARHRARQLGVRLELVRGTGPLGRITGSDVDRAAASSSPVVGVPHPSPIGGDELAGLTGHRAVVARRMAQAARETAAVTIMLRADVSRLVGAEGPSLIDVVVHEAVRCVALHPELNATLTRGGIVNHERVGLGYAVDGARGLVVPVVRDADLLSLDEFSAVRRRLVRAALEARLVQSDLEGGTFTVSNLGRSGLEFFTPIITPGQTAVLGLGAALPTVVATHEGTAFGIRTLIGLSLTFDHRIVDGAEAGRFLQDLAGVLAAGSSAG